MTDELIARLEKATGPDRELDEAILLVVDRNKFEWCHRKFEEILARAEANGLTNRRDACWRDAFSACPAYTRSLDAALTLVPDAKDGWFEIIRRHAPNSPMSSFGVTGMYQAEVGFWKVGKPHWARHGYPAIALCTAAFKALAAQSS